MSDVSIDTLLIKIVCIGIMLYAASWGLHHLNEYGKCHRTAAHMETNAKYDVFAGCWVKDDNAPKWLKLGGS